MSIDLEYAIKQDIRNNPVVREVDAAQRRQFVRSVLWGGAIVVMLMFALVPKSAVVAKGYQIERLREAVARAEAEQRKLRLELEMLRRPQEIEKRAISELHMVAPTERTTIVLERVPASAPPNRAIVAAVR